MIPNACDSSVTLAERAITLIAEESWVLRFLLGCRSVPVLLARIDGWDAVHDGVRRWHGFPCVVREHGSGVGSLIRLIVAVGILAIRCCEGRRIQV